MESWNGGGMYFYKHIPQLFQYLNVSDSNKLNFNPRGHCFILVKPCESKCWLYLPTKVQIVANVWYLTEVSAVQIPPSITSRRSIRLPKYVQLQMPKTVELLLVLCSFTACLFYISQITYISANVQEIVVLFQTKKQNTTYAENNISNNI